MNDFVAKPFELEHLLGTLERWGGPIAAVVCEASSPAPPPPPVVSESSELPERFGDLEIATAVRRLGNKPANYLAIVRQFLDTQTAVVEEIERALAQGNMKEAQRLAHGLKGPALYVGAETLAQAAGDVEKAIKEADVLKAQQLLPQFGSVMQSTVNSLHALIG